MVDGTSVIVIGFVFENPVAPMEAVEIVTVQPDAIVPEFGCWSSTTYSCQVPFGLEPLKTVLNVAFSVGKEMLYGGAGAGAGNVSASPPCESVVLKFRRESWSA